MTTSEIPEDLRFQRYANYQELGGEQATVGAGVLGAEFFARTFGDKGLEQYFRARLGMLGEILKERTL